MGNQLNTSNASCNPMSIKRKKVSIAPNDSFIIKYCHNAKDKDHEIDILSLDTRRVVFVSLMGLFQTWEQCPSAVLYSCLLIMPLKRIWIYHPSQYQEEIQSHFVSEISLFSDMAEKREFLELMKWKDSQGLVCWMIDEYESNSSEIDPIWYYLNKKLLSLYDPITGENYKGIHLNPNWWKNELKYISKYRVKTSTILHELYNPSLRFKSIQEMLHQSNPDSFVPVICYSRYNMGKESNDNDENENWWISCEYDPYDVDHNVL